MNLLASTRRISRQAGFTIMEVLVSMFISAMIMTAVLASLESTQKAVDAIHNITLTERAGPQLVEMFRRDIRRLAVFDNGQYSILRGESQTKRGTDADKIDMLVHGRSVLPQYDAIYDRKIYAPVNEVGYWVRERAGSADFLELYRREDFMVDDEPWAGGNFSMLNDRIVRFDLQYYEEPEFDPLPEDDWDSLEMAQLPFAIELALELEIQPRKSAESRAIIGANRSRLEFTDILTISEPTRFVFRNRLFPMVPGVDATGSGQAAGAGDPSSESQEDITEGIGEGGTNTVGVSRSPSGG